MGGDLSQEILIAVTTFHASRERSLILRKVLRRFRLMQPGTPYRILLLSDGPVRSRPLIRYVDYLFQTREPRGLQWGEHFCIQAALDLLPGDISTC